MWCVSVQLVPLGWQHNIGVIQTWIVIEQCYRVTIFTSHLDGACVTQEGNIEGGPLFDITQHCTCHGSCSDDTENYDLNHLSSTNLKIKILWIFYSFKMSLKSGFIEMFNHWIIEVG